MVHTALRAAPTDMVSAFGGGAVSMRYAVQLARATGAPIVPGYVRRLEGCRFLARCLAAIHLPPEEGPALKRMDDIMMLNALMEPLVSENLDQWYFLHDRIE